MHYAPQKVIWGFSCKALLVGSPVRFHTSFDAKDIQEALLESQLEAKFLAFELNI